MRLLHGTSWTIGAAVHPDYRLLVAARCSASGKIDPNKLGAAFCLPPTPAFVTHHWPPIMLIPRQPAIETRLKSDQVSSPSVHPAAALSDNCSTVQPSSWLPHHATIRGSIESNSLPVTGAARITRLKKSS